MKLKRTVIGGLMLSSLFLLGGCSVGNATANKLASITIPFQWFKEAKVSKPASQIPKVNGLDLTQETVQVENVQNVTQNLSKMSELLSNNQNFNKIAHDNEDVMRVLGSDLISFHYDSNHDDFTKTIQDFGKTPYQVVHNLTLCQYGVRLNDKGQRQNIAVVDVNAVNDTMNFHVQSLQFVMDNEGLPLSSVKVGTPEDTPHTATPLTNQSLLKTDTHQQFASAIQNVIQSLSDQTLYQRVANGELKKSDQEFKSLAKEMGIDPSSSATLFDLVKDGEGQFSEWGITGYLYDDTNVSGRTLYELTVADEKGMHLFTVTFNRGTNQIENITKGSPFKGELQ